MQIQVNTGRDVDGNAALTAHVEAAVKKALHHLEEHLTRVEVYLEDENGPKAGADDKSCKIEARPKHHEPVAVSDRADNLHQAVDGATRKMKSSLERLFGKLEGRHRRPEITDEEGEP